MRRWGMLGVALAAAAFAHAVPAQAAGDCEGLSRLKIEVTNLLASAVVPSNGDLPRYCRVLGYVRPAINFEVRLPVADWNGKYYQAGCGGFCGGLNADVPGFTNAMNAGLRRNYAVATTDAGHWGASAADGRWALANPIAKADWAWRAETETARIAKTLVRAYYGAEPQHAYFAGCSTGGRMAGVEATRFPQDFDGIIMGAPALDYTGLVATNFAWLVQANTEADGKPVFARAKLPLLRDAVAKAYHAPDGLVADPRDCDFQPARLLCTDGVDVANCLTAAEVATLEKLYAGAHDGRGRQLYPGGLAPGSEANWPLWLIGTDKSPPLAPLFGRNFLRYMAFEPDAGATYTTAQFDFDRDPARLAPMAALYNAATWVPGQSGSVAGTVVGADLSAFAKRGGRMIVYHGWGDPLVTPYFTVAWYEAWARIAGGMERAQDTARLFMIPGMDHCGINTNNASITDTGIDPLSALERWVEHDTPPAELVATKRGNDGKTLWQRPVCAYPQRAKLVSTDPALATSWQCAAP
jgi:Tannase and feruloyl esterase